MSKSIRKIYMKGKNNTAPREMCKVPELGRAKTNTDFPKISNFIPAI